MIEKSIQMIENSWLGNVNFKDQAVRRSVFVQGRAGCCVNHKPVSVLQRKLELK